MIYCICIILDEPMKCIPMKGAFNMNLYSAMDGYDMVKSNPYDPNGDPGIKNRIFVHDCFEGYYDFISDVIISMNCQSDFSMKKIESLEEYNQERGSSTSTSHSVGASASNHFNK